MLQWPELSNKRLLLSFGRVSTVMATLLTQLLRSGRLVRATEPQFR